MSDHEPDIPVIVLAAGSSSRLGRPKQLLTYQGKSLLQRTLETASQGNLGTTVVVLGANANAIIEQVELKGIKVVINNDWKEGLSSSIRCGLSKLLEVSPNSQEVMFLLSDQPLLNVDVLTQLKETHEENHGGIAVCEYGDQWGVPMIFDRRYFEELMTLEGDSGAKKIAMKYKDRVRAVPFSGGSFDIDTEEDFQKLKSLGDNPD